MSNEPKNLSNEQMGALVAKLKAEGRLPSREKLQEVIGKVRQEYQPKILAERKVGTTPSQWPAAG